MILLDMVWAVLIATALSTSHSFKLQVIDSSNPSLVHLKNRNIFPEMVISNSEFMFRLQLAEIIFHRVFSTINSGTLTLQLRD